MARWVASVRMAWSRYLPRAISCRTAPNGAHGSQRRRCDGAVMALPGRLRGGAASMMQGTVVRPSAIGLPLPLPLPSAPLLPSVCPPLTADVNLYGAPRQPLETDRMSREASAASLSPPHAPVGVGATHASPRRSIVASTSLPVLVVGYGHVAPIAGGRNASCPGSGRLGGALVAGFGVAKGRSVSLSSWAERLLGTGATPMTWHGGARSAASTSAPGSIAAGCQDVGGRFDAEEVGYVERDGDGHGKGDEAGGRAIGFKYMMVLAYEGTDFSGWQRQPNRTTIQGEVEAALTKVTRYSADELGLVVAGRTDAGVHARAQVVHFATDRGPLANLPRTFVALNAVLPRTIRIRRLARVPPTFHARYSATGKTYHYEILNAPAHDVFRRRCCFYFGKSPLDRAAMAEAAAGFVGTHNFSAFANASEIKERDPVRTITRFDLVELDDEGAFRFEVEGTGFLYKQVRNMVGLLLAIGAGRQATDALQSLLESRDRKQVALVCSCAKPQGLFLHAVHYPEHELWLGRNLEPGVDFVCGVQFPKDEQDWEVVKQLE